MTKTSTYSDPLWICRGEVAQGAGYLIVHNTNAYTTGIQKMINIINSQLVSNYRLDGKSVSSSKRDLTTLLFFRTFELNRHEQWVI